MNEQVREYVYMTRGVPMSDAKGLISLPRENIVRCRDCMHYNEQEPGGEIGTCNLGLEDLDLLSIVEPNGFCAWGERRES